MILFTNVSKSNIINFIERRIRENLWLNFNYFSLIGLAVDLCKAKLIKLKLLYNIPTMSRN